jgi:hypothetical protein
MVIEMTSQAKNSEPVVALEKSFSRSDKWLLLVFTIIGALIRFIYLYDRAFTGDEVGTLIYIKKDIPYLLSHFTTWLTMNYYIVLEKIMAVSFGQGFFSLGFISLVAGIATIPLTALLSVRFTTPRIALGAAALTCMNPYLIQFSAIIRSYSLLAALSVTLLIVFFKWCDCKSYKYGIAVGGVAFVLNLAHPNGVYTVIYIICMLIMWLFKASDKRKYLGRTITLLIPMGLSCGCIFMAYYNIFPEMLRDGIKWHEVPPTSVSYIPYAFSQYFSGGFYGWISAALFFTGLLRAYKCNNHIVTLFPAMYLPILLTSLQGLSHFPWGYARFFIFIVPIIIIVIAVGVDYFATTYFNRQSIIVSIVLTVFLVISWTPRLVHMFDDKSNYPWHKVANYVKSTSGPRDIIVGNDMVEPFHLSQFYPEMQDRITSLGEGLTRLGSAGADPAMKVFYVTYSYSTSQLASPILPPSHYVNTTQPTEYFGKIQVITYGSSPDKSSSILQKIRGDLIDTVKAGQELAPEFTPIYKNVWDLNNYLAVDSNNFCYYNLWTQCSSLTDRQKYIPLSLQNWQLRPKMKTCK